MLLIGFPSAAWQTACGHHQITIILLIFFFVFFFSATWWNACGHHQITVIFLIGFPSATWQTTCGHHQISYFVGYFCPFTTWRNAFGRHLITVILLMVFRLLLDRLLAAITSRTVILLIFVSLQLLDKTLVMLLLNPFSHCLFRCVCSDSGGRGPRPPLRQDDGNQQPDQPHRHHCLRRRRRSQRLQGWRRQGRRGLRGGWRHGRGWGWGWRQPKTRSQRAAGHQDVRLQRAVVVNGSFPAVRVIDSLWVKWDIRAATPAAGMLDCVLFVCVFVGSWIMVWKLQVSHWGTVLISFGKAFIYKLDSGLFRSHSVVECVLPP